MRPENLAIIQEIIAYQEFPTHRKLNYLVNKHLGMVCTCAKRLMHRTNEPLDDLIQEGSIGLVKAIHKFDASKGVTFSTFAGIKIRGEILHYIRDRGSLIRIPRAWDAAKVKFLDLVENKKDLSPAEIAERTGIKLSEQLDAYMALRGRNIKLCEAALLETTEQSLPW